MWLKSILRLMTMKKVLFALLLILGVVSVSSSAGPVYPEPTAKNTQWGYAYMNNGFKLVIDYQFDEADTFDAVLPRARVLIGDEYFLIDDTGKKCAGPYEHVSMWADPATGYYIYVSGEEEGIIDMDGKVILEPKYTQLSFSGDGSVAGLLNGDYVEINLTKE